MEHLSYRLTNSNVLKILYFKKSFVHKHILVERYKDIQEKKEFTRFLN